MRIIEDLPENIRMEILEHIIRWRTVWATKRPSSLPVPGTAPSRHHPDPSQISKIFFHNKYKRHFYEVHMMETTCEISMNHNKSEEHMDGRSFLEVLFAKALEKGCGEIEIRGIIPGSKPLCSFHSSIEKALQKALELSEQGYNAYMGVNPRMGGGGKKVNVHYLTAFFVDLDVGTAGHKKDSNFPSKEDAWKAIKQFPLQPSLIVDSGGGFHLYWILEEPVAVEQCGVEKLEAINSVLSRDLHGDPGTHDISRILRVPGTLNYKNDENPRPVKIVEMNENRYRMEEFRSYSTGHNGKVKAENPARKVSDSQRPGTAVHRSRREIRAILKRKCPHILNLIRHGNQRQYKSRSEADFAVILALRVIGTPFKTIRGIFKKYSIGEKYREHSKPDYYLKRTIKKARQVIEDQLESEENIQASDLLNPLFAAKALSFQNKRFHLDLVRFEEHVGHALRIKRVNQSLYRYNGRCYESLSPDLLNEQCQSFLGRFRYLFPPKAFKDFLHFAAGDPQLILTHPEHHRTRHLAFQNGILDLTTQALIDHTPDLFITHLLPYNYDPHADCPRFRQFLDEIFASNFDVIQFVQEAMGYIFHAAIPQPALFVFLGNGANGKSILLKVIAQLAGERNAASIPLTKFDDPAYRFQLRNKLVNLYHESPPLRCFDSSDLKAVISGDPITARQLYQDPVTFQPMAKHFMAMNQRPVITDPTHGLWRRLYFIDFPRTFHESEQDKDLLSKLVSELAGICNWALEGYRRLRLNHFTFTQVEAMDELKLNVKKESNPILEFLDAHYEKGHAKDQLRFGEVYQGYVDFCQKTNQPHRESDKRFSALLRNMGMILKKGTGNKLYLHGFKPRVPSR